MPTMYDDVDARCPFFMGSSKTTIICEGITNRCSLTTMWATKDERNKHKHQFCDNNYKKCSIACMLDSKYE